MATSEYLTEAQAYLVLNGLPNIGPITLNRILEEIGPDPRAVLNADPNRLLEIKGVGPVIAETIGTWSQQFDLPREEERMARTGVSFIPSVDDAYPVLLREIHDPPIGLYRDGECTAKLRCIAMVGSRRTTAYGQMVARTLAGELVRAGFCVVSGLARGIDTHVHEGALAAGGKTIAVLGCGIDIAYPPENAALSRRIAENGAVYSEFPYTRRADRQSFAMRNRIVSGMSSAVVVVETDEDGGSMITARFAGEQGRLLFAVPGRIDQPQSRGCHQLIRDGATLCTGIDDILAELDYLKGLAPRNGIVAAIPPPVEVEGEAGQVFSLIPPGEVCSVDRLADQTGLGAGEVSGHLLLLEMRGLVVRRIDGNYERVGR